MRQSTTKLLWAALICAPVCADVATQVAPATEPVARRLAVVNFSDTAQPPQSIPTTESQRTLTVGPLLAEHAKNTWLSKAIADLLIKSFSQAASIVVLDRERMQTFTDEVALSDSALADEERALRVGRVAKVDQVVFGDYRLDGETISLTVSLLNLKDQKIVRRSKTTGSYGELRSLVAEAAVTLLREEHVALTDEEERNIRFAPTSSMPATERFYHAMDHYDRGRYPEAIGELLQALRQDSSFAEAQLWLGRMFEAIGEYDHAVASHLRLHERRPQSTEARDALYFAARVLEDRLGDDAEAIDVYRRLVKLRPTSPHTLEASFRLGRLLFSRGELVEAYRQFHTIDTFCSRARRDPERLRRSQGRASTFFGWEHALTLFRESIASMATIFRQLDPQTRSAEGLTAPRGVLVLSAADPTHVELRFDRTASLFDPEGEEPGWRERLYVVIVPRGHRATGVDLSVTGRLRVRRPYHSYAMRVLPFPLPRDHERRWFGAIFGQTARFTTLQKQISFHGEHQGVFAVQLAESQAEVRSWRLEVQLRPDDGLPSPRRDSERKSVKGFWEGQPLGSVDLPPPELVGSTRSRRESYYEPKKELDLIRHPRHGFFLVSADGQLDASPTELSLAQSQDGRRWSTFAPLEIDSQSEDYSPRWSLSEDGRLWLSWISTRRGRGWELWMASLERFAVKPLVHEHRSESGPRTLPSLAPRMRARGASQTRWSRPRRVPLERFVDAGMEERIHVPSQLLEYDILQDRRGQWILAYYSLAKRQVVVLKASSVFEWQVAASIVLKSPAYGISLAEDSSGVLRLCFLGTAGTVHLWSSVDAKRWQRRKFTIKFWNQSTLSTARAHRVRLFPLARGELLLLLSDNQYGLQFSHFHPDTDEPVLDLVTRAGLEPYAAAAALGGEFIVALKGDEHVDLRQYRKFNVSGEPIDKDTRNWPIYRETESDADGNVWTRIFAQARVRVSDVTSLGIDPSGRIWWGIESGVMYKDKDRFLATDVSQGFFHHFVTHITASRDGRVWFGSTHLPQPRLGSIHNPRSIDATLATGVPPRFHSTTVPQLSGAIADIEFGSTEGRISVGTTAGDVAEFDGRRVYGVRNVRAPVTALAYDAERRDLWVATDVGDLHVFNATTPDHSRRVRLPKVATGRRILDIALDAQRALWVGVSGTGMLRLNSVDRQPEWRHYTPNTSPVLYWSIGSLVPDPRSGVWYLPAAEERSVGLGYFDGVRHRVLNPPHEVLSQPSSLVVEPDGRTVWIGTWFNGLYQITPRREAP